MVHAPHNDAPAHRPLSSRVVLVAREFQSALADRIADENVTFHVQREGHDVNVKLKLPGK